MTAPFDKDAWIRDLVSVKWTGSGWAVTVAGQVMVITVERDGTADKLVRRLRTAILASLPSMITGQAYQEGFSDGRAAVVDERDVWKDRAKKAEEERDEARAELEQLQSAQGIPFDRGAWARKHIYVKREPHSRQNEYNQTVVTTHALYVFGRCVAREYFWSFDGNVFSADKSPDEWEKNERHSILATLPPVVDTSQSYQEGFSDGRAAVADERDMWKDRAGKAEEELKKLRAAQVPLGVKARPVTADRGRSETWPPVREPIVAYRRRSPPGCPGRRPLPSQLPWSDYTDAPGDWADEHHGCQWIRVSDLFGGGA